MAAALTPAQRTLRARVAAHALHAQGGTSTTAGTAAFLARFEREVDPDGVLAPDERARRAEHARKSYMSKLALKASRTRTCRKATRTEKTAAVSDAPATVGAEQTSDARHD